MDLGWLWGRVIALGVREVMGWGRGGQAFFPLDDFYLLNSFP